MKEKEIKTYGELAETAVVHISSIAYDIKNGNFEEAEYRLNELKLLHKKYGSNVINQCVQSLSNINYYTGELKSHSNIYTGYAGAYYFTCCKLEKINKLKAELDKEIEE